MDLRTIIFSQKTNLEKATCSIIGVSTLLHLLRPSWFMAVLLQLLIATLIYSEVSQHV